jgi:hypothetical protein
MHGRRGERPEERGPALRDAIPHDGPSPVDVVMESPVRSRGETCDGRDTLAPPGKR